MHVNTLKIEKYTPSLGLEYLYLHALFIIFLTPLKDFSVLL